MDRRTALAIFLTVTIYYVWMMLRTPEQELDADGNPIVAEADGSADAPPVAPEASPEPAPAPVAVPEADRRPERVLDMAACEFTGELTTHGGGLSDVILPDQEGPLQVQPLYSWLWGMVSGGGGVGWKPWGDDPGPQRILTVDALGLQVGAGPWGNGPAQLDVVTAEADHVTLRGTVDGLSVTHDIEAVDRDGECLLAVTTTWANNGRSSYSGPLWVGVHDRIPPMAGGMLARYDSRVQPLMYADDDLNYGSGEGGVVGGCMGVGGKDPEGAAGLVAVDGPVDWFGLADRYYGFLVVNETDGGVGHFSVLEPAADDDPEGPVAGAHIAWTPTLAPGQSHTAKVTAYVGPLDTDRMVAIHSTLGEAVDLGFFAFFGYPLLILLRFFQSIVGNWGVAIILLTVSVKAVFFPMTQASFRSMQKMQQIQPEMNRIREEYADNPQEMNRLTMELMAREKVNPLSGCLPMVVQMPVWFALYQVLLTSVDLYHTDFLYLRDLSAPDPYCILPIAVMAMMLLQQQFTNTANMDPAQARVMRFMPLIFGAFFFTFPSGLAVYVFVNMLLSIAQQWWIKRSLGEAPAMPVV